jgi:hypothetical protein
MSGKKKRKFHSAKEIFETYIPGYTPRSQAIPRYSQGNAGIRLASKLLRDFKNDVKKPKGESMHQDEET